MYLFLRVGYFIVLADVLYVYVVLLHTCMTLYDIACSVWKECFPIGMQYMLSMFLMNTSLHVFN